MGRLDEVTRRRIAALLLVAGAIAAALALTDAGPFSDPPSAEERAGEAVEDFFAAGREEDFDAVCRSLTRDARGVVEILGARIATEKGLHGCAEILAVESGEELAGTEATVSDVRISGNRAAVDVELTAEGAKRPQPRTFELVLVNGRWKVNDFGG